MESKFESDVKFIDASQQQVYDTLSDLSRLQQLKEKLSSQVDSDKLDAISITPDTLTASVPPVGAVTLRIIERQPCKLIKFEAEQSPVPFNLWLQLLPTGDETCKMKLTLKAELNPFIKAVVNKPLSEGIEKMAEAIASIKYKEITL